MSGDIASRFNAVSTSVSPLTTLEVAMATLSVSELRRFSATSNEVRVRVLGSKKRLTTVRPRSVGTFLIGRCAISCIASAVSSTSTISSGDRSAMPSRCLWRSRVAGVIGDAWGLSPPIVTGESGLSPACGAGGGPQELLVGLHDNFVMTVYLLEPHLDAFAPRRGHVLADVVRLDRQLAMPAIDEHDQMDRLGTPEVDQRIERSANRPAGIEHVVDEQDHAIVEIERDVRAPHERLRPHRLTHQIVAVERDGEGAGRHRAAGDLEQLPGDAAGDRHAALADADEREVLDPEIALDDLVRDAGQRARQSIAVHYDGHRDLEIADCGLRIADCDCADCAPAARARQVSFTFTSLRPRRAALKSASV